MGQPKKTLCFINEMPAIVCDRGWVRKVADPNKKWMKGWNISDLRKRGYTVEEKKSGIEFISGQTDDLGSD
jgi:hypothetical protein